jgi:teichuronic acid biosynthesis glycosyltransferase TuaH
MNSNDEVWQILDVGSVWMKEFAAAMTAHVPTISWCPSMRFSGVLQSWERVQQMDDPPLRFIEFPLQRGYARSWLRHIVHFEKSLLRHLRRKCPNPARSPLVCSTPFYASVAEQWPGPVIYYVTDLTACYDGLNPAQVNQLDRRMCRVAASVCPNSHRIERYLIEKAGCSPEKIHLVPNATRASNLALQPLLTPGALPLDIAHLPRPIVGVIGNLAGNMDWQFLDDAISQTPNFTWVFVGPTSMPIPEKAEAEARTRVLGSAYFTGSKAYGELQAYARSFDVAVLPYRKKEPTYSGSSTRFYEHLAACRPMIATRGFAELSEKQPLVELINSPSELAAALQRLQRCDFDDGLQARRWDASRTGTWEERAKSLISSIAPDFETVQAKIVQVS